ncbi:MULTISPECIES: TauD/TfdA family dioxygenase [unclassified Parafrankia]|uniref:TauD/TfdA family dioxygenase n=1 Tax=unclassified Parafrankia TaxID=2994368 RepID=UPI00135936E7|nr:MULTISPECIES: TauD/TfdA family dioxygenase [unclassified Parafrankia]
MRRKLPTGPSSHRRLGSGASGPHTPRQGGRRDGDNDGSGRTAGDAGGGSDHQRCRSPRAARPGHGAGHTAGAARKALFVNEAWTTRIVELQPAESAHLLALLFEHVKSPDFTMRYRWAPNDLAIWDNLAVQHYAVPDYGTPG